MKWKPTKELLKQSAIPAAIALIYAIWDYHSSKEAFKPTAFLKSLGACFFLVMWFTGQYLRVSKQLEDKEQNAKINDIHAALRPWIEQGMLSIHAGKGKKGVEISAGNFDNELKRKRSQILELMATPSRHEEIRKAAIEYSAIADAAAERKLERVTNVDLNVGNLSIEAVQRVHRSLFPEGFELAGRLRTSPVAIAPDGSTTRGPVENAMVPPDPSEMLEPLEHLFGNWNSKFKSIQKSTDDEKLRAITEFHHRFTAIHPFLDGNGRLARTILAKQLSELLGWNLRPSQIEADQDYFKALRKADRGDLSELLRWLGKFEKR